MHYRLHRSLTFWLGIFAIAFIFWAWWLSNHRSLDFSIRKWRFSQAFSGVSVQRYQYFQPAELSKIASDNFRQVLLPAPFYVSGGGKSIGDAKEFNSKTYVQGRSVSDWAPGYFEYLPRGARLIFIPHWLILLAFTVPWIGFLVWRSRLGKTAASSHEVV